DFDSQGHRRFVERKKGPVGPLLQRRALLVSPGGPVKRPRQRPPLRLAAHGSRLAAQFRQLSASGARVGLMLARGAPPAALAEPGGSTTRDDAKDRSCNDEGEQRQRN